jgi:N-acetylmuramoyl-L-alanine amidase
MKRSLVLLFLCFASQALAWEGVVIHHTATETGNVESIRRYHVNERGWADVGYHYLITRDGVVEAGRPLTQAGAHALNPSPSRNRSHIGVALVGTDHFTDRQYEALRGLMRELDAKFGTLSYEQHHDQCPGPGFNWARLTLQEEA